MVVTIGVFVGNLSNANVQRVVSNHGWMLGERFNLDLITTSPENYDTHHYRDKVGDQFSQSSHGAIRALNHYHSEYQPDVIYHTNRPPIHGGLVTALGKRTDTTTVFRYPGDTFQLYRVAEGWKKIPYFVLNNIIGQLPLALADKAVVLGPHGHDQLVSRGVSPSNIAILPPAIDVDSFRGSAPADLTIPDDRKVVLFVGRRTHLKGIKTIEAAIPEILARREDLQFVFVGKGKDIIVDDEWADHVTLVGRVPPSSVPAYLQEAALLILPSLTEGVPRVLLEALATRTPVIARDVGEVATVTDNTFTKDARFVELVTEFESLPIDTVDPFDRATLREYYVEFFENL